jgi:hypothetical protein
MEHRRIDLGDETPIARTPEFLFAVPFFTGMILIVGLVAGMLMRCLFEKMEMITGFSIAIGGRIVGVTAETHTGQNKFTENENTEDLFEKIIHVFTLNKDNESQSVDLILKNIY